MDVILLEKIHKLGNLGDQVKVKSGFGRNYLIPTGKAVSATTENIAKFEARRAELEKQHQDTLAIANGRAEKIDGLNVVIPRRASAEGKLYGSIGTADIVEAVNGKPMLNLLSMKLGCLMARYVVLVNIV